MLDSRIENTSKYDMHEIRGRSDIWLWIDNPNQVHTTETLNCELIVDPEEVQLNNWQLHV